jgi:hypothetical protein
VPWLSFAGNWRHKRERAGGQHQRVVFDFQPAHRKYFAGFTVDRNSFIAEMNFDAVLVEKSVCTSEVPAPFYRKNTT